jgi:hypothetical protein
LARSDPEKLPDRYEVERAVEASSLAPIARHIILVLCSRMSQGSTLIPAQYSPSLTKFALGTGWDRRTIMRHLRDLEEAGCITRHRPPADKARREHARTNYTVWLGAIKALARDREAQALGADSAQARDAASPGLGAGRPGPRGAAPSNQTVSDHGTDRSGEITEDLAELVVKQLAERTGVTVTREWAEKTRDLLLARPGIKNPRAYIIRTITTDPHPERWLPTPEPPPYHREEQL